MLSPSPSPSSLAGANSGWFDIPVPAYPGRLGILAIETSVCKSTVSCQLIQNIIPTPITIIVKMLIKANHPYDL